MSREYHSELWLPRRREEVFPFFASAENLQVLTPDWLHFTIVTPLPIRMEMGRLIDYRLRVHGFRIDWQSEITAWEPPDRFVDEQRRGPYRLWVHEHLFEEKSDGTLVKDHVRYAVPGGGLVDRLLVRRDIEAIFAFRRQKLLELFPPTQPAS